MKITVIVPTGEVRRANKGEWWQGHYGEWSHLATPTVDPHPIAHSHEVEVPDDTELIRINRVYDVKPDSLHEYTLLAIPLPRKKKVKKWRWEHIQGDIVWRTELLYTEEEMKKYYGHTAQFRKIPETEIEVEALI
jgi:hypothetical protein